MPKLERNPLKFWSLFRRPDFAAIHFMLTIVCWRVELKSGIPPFTSEQGLTVIDTGVKFFFIVRFLRRIMHNH